MKQQFSNESAISKNGRNTSNFYTTEAEELLEICQSKPKPILKMKTNINILVLLLICSISTYAQSIKEEQEILQLSKDKWQWMADKDVDKLKDLFDDKAKFVHMSGTWKTDEELEVIKTGSIWYKEAKVHDSAIEVSGNTAIVWNRITLIAMVRGNEAKTEFTVTEVYQKQKKDWKMLALTFSSVRDTHQIKK